MRLRLPPSADENRGEERRQQARRIKVSRTRASWAGLREERRQRRARPELRELDEERDDER